MFQAVLNSPAPNRLQLKLGNLQGPLAASGVAFSAEDDLIVLVDGEAFSMQSSQYDSTNNRYLLYADRAFPTGTVVQVLHHMPSPPYAGTNGTLPGLALIATWLTTVD